MPLDAPPDETLSLTSLETAFVAALAEDGGGASAAQSAFLARIWDDYRPGELAGVSSGDLGEVLARFWRFGAALKGESPTVRLSRATGQGGRDLGLDLLEIVQPDAPFLVDSVMGEVGESGAEVRAMFHPIVGAAPALESMIQVWLEPVGEERRAGLIERVPGSPVVLESEIDRRLRRFARPDQADQRHHPDQTGSAHRSAPNISNPLPEPRIDNTTSVREVSTDQF